MHKSLLLATTLMVVALATPAMAGPFNGKGSCVGRYRIARVPPTMDSQVAVIDVQINNSGTFTSFKRMADLGAYGNPLPALKKGLDPSNEALVNAPQVPTLGTASGEVVVKVLGLSHNTNTITFTMGSVKFHVLGGAHGNLDYVGDVSCAATRDMAIAELHV